MKVYIRTFGCSANINDSEIMASLLAKAGHDIVNSEQKADALLVNTCTVKGKTQTHILRYLKGLDATKKLVVAGCMAQVQGELVRWAAPGASLIGVNQLDKVAEAFTATHTFVSQQKLVKAGLPKERVNPVIDIVQINEGCLGSCAFCITKLAKPRLFSYPEECILQDVEQGVNDGCREFWLTSQDTGAYGFGQKTSIAKLLKNICSIRGDFIVRVGMLNPEHARRLLPEVINALKHRKALKFLHIPVQSGSDTVLKSMNRPYTAEDFRKIVNGLKKSIPRITISTDIICGFPGETESQFRETLELMEELRLDTINVSRFWSRPGTKADSMSNQINGRISNERSRQMVSLFQRISLEKNKEWIGWHGKALVDEKGINGTVVCRNDFYKPIVLKSSQGLMGQFVRVKVTGATKYCLLGITE